MTRSSSSPARASSVRSSISHPPCDQGPPYSGPPDAALCQTADVSGEERHGNLPSSVASLIGREAALTPIADLTRTHPLVTLSGVGGVGKTRLALAVAAQLVDEFPDGLWLVELAPVHAADAVPDAIAQALGITPQGDTPVIETVAEAVAGRRLLILLDNCEHLLAAAAA